jgi:hypothetical protein
MRPGLENGESKRPDMNGMDEEKECGVRSGLGVGSWETSRKKTPPERHRAGLDEPYTC